MQLTGFEEESKGSPAAICCNLDCTTGEHVTRKGGPESEGMRIVGKGCIRCLLFVQLGFIRCPSQLLRSYKRHEENKRKIGQECSSMQQADYQCHRPIDARKCVHEKSSTKLSQFI